MFVIHELCKLSNLVKFDNLSDFKSRFSPEFCELENALGGHYLVYFHHMSVNKMDSGVTAANLLRSKSLHWCTKMYMVADYHEVRSHLRPQHSNIIRRS